MANAIDPLPAHQNDENTRHLHLHVLVSDEAAFQRLAQSRDQSLSATFRFLLRYYLGTERHRP